MNPKTLLHVSALLSCSIFCVCEAGTSRAAEAAKGIFQHGAFCGQVIDADNGKPVADATVALRDRHNHIVSWTKTDTQGHYILAADIALLDLPSPRRRGMMASIKRGAVEVFQIPVRAVGAAAGTAMVALKSTDPVGMLKTIAIGTLAGNPVAVAPKADGSVQTVIGTKTQEDARRHAAEAVVNGAPISASKDTPDCGEVGLMISAPQYKDYRGTASSYWMSESSETEDKTLHSAQAWLDTVKLASTHCDKKSQTEDQAARLTDPSLDTEMAAAGTPLKVTVHLQTPAEPSVHVRVVAREQKTRNVTELTCRGDGVYSGTLILNPGMPMGDTTITVAALKAKPFDLRDSKGKDDAVLVLASHLDSLDAKKPYLFDPRVMASENRLDLETTVLDPKLETPPPASSTAINSSAPSAAPATSSAASITINTATMPNPASNPVPAPQTK